MAWTESLIFQSTLCHHQAQRLICCRPVTRRLLERQILVLLRTTRLRLWMPWLILVEFLTGHLHLPSICTMLIPAYVNLDSGWFPGLVNLTSLTRLGCQSGLENLQIFSQMLSCIYSEPGTIYKHALETRANIEDDSKSEETASEAVSQG